MTKLKWGSDARYKSRVQEFLAFFAECSEEFLYRCASECDCEPCIQLREMGMDLCLAADTVASDTVE